MIKDQKTLLQLIAKLPSTTLDIVGDGVLRDDLELCLLNNSILVTVCFFMDIFHVDELPHFYQQAHYLLMTSRHEAFCMAAIEALACGTGVIGTAVGMYFPRLACRLAVGSVDALQQLIIQRSRKKGHIQSAYNTA